MVYLASDHGGFKLKSELIDYLYDKVDLEDVGPFELVEQDDYPDYVVPTVQRVLEDTQSNQSSKAILICRNGVGVSILANRFKGIRCALSWAPEHAQTSREDDNSNVLALPADYVDLETAKKIVLTWLETPFSKKERHIRRLKKVKEVQT